MIFSANVRIKQISLNNIQRTGVQQQQRQCERAEKCVICISILPPIDKIFFALLRVHICAKSVRKTIIHSLVSSPTPAETLYLIEGDIVDLISSAARNLNIDGCQ